MFGFREDKYDNGTHCCLFRPSIVTGLRTLASFLRVSLVTTLLLLLLLLLLVVHSRIVLSTRYKQQNRHIVVPILYTKKELLTRHTTRDMHVRTCVRSQILWRNRQRYWIQPHPTPSSPLQAHPEGSKRTKVLIDRAASIIRHQLAEHEHSAIHKK